MPPDNVRNIMQWSELVPATIIILNVMLRPGVNKTDIIRRPVLFRLMLMNSVRTVCLTIKAVRKTVREPAGRPVMLTLVLRDAFMQPPTAARGILLTVNAVPHRPLPDVRPTTALTVPVLLPVPTPAVTPVIVVVPIPVLPDLKTIPALWPDIPNAVRPVTDVKTVHPEVLLIPELMSVLPNAGLVMPVPIPAGRVLNPSPVLQPKIR